MGGINVKITMFQRALKSIAPDLCYFCGKIGASFCSHCKYDITHESASVCFWCGVPASLGVCPAHSKNIERVFMAAWYEDGIKRALEGLKFQNDRFVAGMLAEVLDMQTPQLPKDAVIVPVPTLQSSVRRRGYDQALLIAKMFAKRRGIELKPIVRRIGRHVQHDTEDRKERERQVRGSFKVIEEVTPLPRTIVLVDDIITTGATANEIARILKHAGVERVFVAAVAHPR